jgi:hypothetical protein
MKVTEAKNWLQTPGSSAGAVEEMMKSEEAISWKCARKRRNIPHDYRERRFQR